MRKAKIKDLCSFLPKSKIKAGEGLEKGKYIFFTSSDIKTMCLNEYLFDEEALILGTGGKPSCNYFNGKFAVSTDNFVLKSDKINIKYLYYFLRNNNLSVLEHGFHGAGLKHISKDYVNDIEIPVLDECYQLNIINNLDLINQSIDFCKNQLIKYDELVKSQFIEMFGNYDKTELSNIAEIIMGQSPESKSYNDIGKGVPFFQGKADYGEKYTIVKHWTTNPTKMAKKNSVLMSVRAPVGPVNIANVDCCIGRGLCSIDSLKGKTNNEFLYNALKVMESDIALMGSGSTFKAINKTDIYNLMLPNAPLDLQNEFSLFAQQIDKSKYFGGVSYAIC